MHHSVDGMRSSVFGPHGSKESSHRASRHKAVPGKVGVLWIAIWVERRRHAVHVQRMNAAPKSHAPDLPHPLQVAAWRKMGPERRAELGAELRHKVRAWKRDALKSQHPDWTKERLENELAQIYLRGNT
jgi:hypothetical protein